MSLLNKILKDYIHLVKLQVSQNIYIEIKANLE